MPSICAFSLATTVSVFIQVPVVATNVVGCRGIVVRHDKQARRALADVMVVRCEQIMMRSDERYLILGLSPLFSEPVSEG